MFSNTTVRGGAEEHMLSLLRGLDRKYFRIQLVCSPQVERLMEHDFPGDVTVFPLAFHQPWQIRAAYQLAQFLLDQQTDILHSHMFRGSLVASPVGNLCGIPVILETPHVREHWRSGWLKSRFFVDRLAGHCVDYYIAVSEANGKYLAAQKGLPARKIRVIRNGCDLQSFNSSPVTRLEARQELGLTEKDPVLVVVGRLEPQKGHRVLLEALPAVRREFPRVKLFCVGTGSLEQELKKLVSALGLGESVKFVGYQADVRKFLAMADVSVLPSFYEGLPLAAIEASAAGCPMVATAVDGTAEVIIHERTGLTVPAGNQGLLAEAICRILRDHELRRNLSQNAQAWVREQFDKSQQLEATQSLYIQAFQQSARGRRLKSARGDHE